MSLFTLTNKLGLCEKEKSTILPPTPAQSQGLTSQTPITLPTLCCMDIKRQVLPDFSCLPHTLPWGGPPQSLWLQHHRKESRKHSRAQDILLSSRLTYIHLPLGSLTDLQLSISTPKVVTCPEASFLPAPRVSGMALPTAVTFSWSVPYTSSLPGPSPPAATCLGVALSFLSSSTLPLCWAYTLSG